MMSRRLSTYLNDHLAGSAVGLELAQRAARSNRGSPLGEFLQTLTLELVEDKRSLERLMAHLGIGVDRVKVLAGWTAEKLGRFKLNGHLLSYSPLSRLEELELLVLAVQGKLLLWRALERWGEVDATVLDLEALITRAESQRRRLERRRLEAVAQAL
jgi:hypothetical protein